MTGLTRKCQYALGALYFLAREYGNGPVLLPRICAQTHAPEEFLHTILLELKNAGLVESRRGPQGGYSLLAPPDQVTVGLVVRIIDGPLVTSPCLSQPDNRSCSRCPQPGNCLTRLLMSEVRDTVTAIMDGTTILAGAKCAAKPTATRTA